MRRALITGITGQDGSYLAEHLLELGYEVHGFVRRVALEDEDHRLWRIAHLRDRLHLHVASLESYPSMGNVFAQHAFDECYHLAARSFAGESFADGHATLSLNITGVQYMLEAVRVLQPECRFYFAGSSEMFGRARTEPQNEDTPFEPRSPYGIGKLAGHHLTRNYRETYGLFCATGILFNHESPRRGFEYVTRKITAAAARIRLGLQKELRLGDLGARRDWGHAREYVKAMQAVLAADEPRDYVVATGVTHTVAECCEIAFGELGLDHREWVKVDERFVRAPERFALVGDAGRAAADLGWKAEIGFEELIREMVRTDLDLASARREAVTAT